MKLLNKIFRNKKPEENHAKDEGKFQIGKYEVPENLIWEMYQIDITLARCHQSGHFDFLDYKVIYNIRERKGMILESTQEYLKTPCKITDNKKETPITINRIEDYLYCREKPLTEYPLIAENNQEIPKNIVNSFCVKELYGTDVTLSGHVLAYLVKNLKD